MSVHQTEFDRVHRSRMRVTVLIGGAVLTGVGAWLTAPFGIVLLTRDDAAGWVVVAIGVLLLAACVTAIVAAVRTRVVPESLPGKANPAFDEPVPSQNPRGGYSTAGMQIGSN